MIWQIFQPFKVFEFWNFYEQRYFLSISRLKNFRVKKIMSLKICRGETKALKFFWIWQISKFKNGYILSKFHKKAIFI